MIFSNTCLVKSITFELIIDVKEVMIGQFDLRFGSLRKFWSIYLFESSKSEHSGQSSEIYIKTLDIQFRSFYLFTLLLEASSNGQ